MTWSRVMRFLLFLEATVFTSELLFVDFAFFFEFKV